MKKLNNAANHVATVTQNVTSPLLNQDLQFGDNNFPGGFLLFIQRHFQRLRNSSIVVLLILTILCNFTLSVAATNQAFQVVREHSPHIRQWWQFWGTKESGRGLALLNTPVRIRFKSDMTGQHTGRLQLEFRGEVGFIATDAYKVYAVAVPYDTSLPVVYPISLALQNNRWTAIYTVPGFSDRYAYIDLVVEQTARDGRRSQIRPLEADFFYTGIFVFEESPGAMDLPGVQTEGDVRPKNLDKVGFEECEIPSMDEQETRVAPKILNVRQPWQKTTTMTAAETRHDYWEWHWGDGEVTIDRNPNHTVGQLERIFQKAGEYVVKAISYSNTGEQIREMVWHLVLDATSIHLPQTFNFETIGIVNPDITITGPKAWVTGRPAYYHVKVDLVEPPFGESVITSIKPSEHFQMVWDKPGRQTITVAVAVVTTYTFPKGKVRVRNVYTRTMDVDVMTLAIRS
jgi:hypothetical protein